MMFSRVFSVWGRSLRIRIATVAILLATTGVSVLGTWVFSAVGDRIEGLLIAEQEDHLRILALNVDREVQERLDAVEKVAGIIVKVSNRAHNGSIQQYLEARPVFNSLFNRGTYFINLDGVATASYPVDWGRVGLNYADRDYFQLALRDTRAVIGRPVLGKPSGKPVLLMAAPVKDSTNTVIGVIVGATDLGKPSFLSVLESGFSSQESTLLLVDSRHDLIVASNDPARLMQPHELPPQEAGKVLTRRADASLVSTVGLRQAGWSLEISTPQQSVLAPLKAIKSEATYAALVVLLATSALLWLMLTREVRPLEKAASQLKRWSGKGSPFSKGLASRSDEMGLLITRIEEQIGISAASEQTLAQTTAMLEFSGKLAKVGAWQLDAQTQHVTWSQQVFQLHGMHGTLAPTWEDALRFFVPPSDERIAEAMRNAVRYGTPFDLELELKTAQGELLWVHVQGEAQLLNGKVSAVHGAIQDITQSKLDALRIHELAFADPVTELANRRLLMDRLEVAIASCLRYQRHGAMLAIDIDGFKLINDSLGQAKGDMLLRAVAAELLQKVRDGDTVARIGADEFVVLLTDLSGNLEEAVEQTRTVADKLLSGLCKSYSLEGLTHYGTASIGVTLFGGTAENLEEPMKRADLALAQAKASGGNSMFFFEPPMQAMIERRISLESAMRQALAQGQFQVYYQPQLLAADGNQPQLSGAEVLVRWLHPKQGMISPAEFIPVAEASGQIIALGQWVLHSACRQIAVWAQDPRSSDLTVSVNVSPRQFHQSDFVAVVLQTLTETGANPHRLKLELTEGMLVANIDEVILKMNSLKTLGVQFSLDDFGTGYSSLSYLKRLPLDQLKIDQSFVRDIQTDPNDAAIAQTIIALGNSLGLSIIAEGVETEGQREFLTAAGCHAFQGYLIGRPMPIEDFARILLSEGDPPEA